MMGQHSCQFGLGFQPTEWLFTHEPEQGLLRTSGLYLKSLSSIDFAGQKSWMFHEAYHVTIKSYRFAKLFQAFEKSADWVLLIGVFRGARVSLLISSVSFYFVLREVLYQTQYCSSLKVTMFGTSKNLGWLQKWLCFLNLAMIQICIYLYSSN